MKTQKKLKDKRRDLAEWLWHTFSEASEDDVLMTFDELRRDEQARWIDLAKTAINEYEHIKEPKP